MGILRMVAFGGFVLAAPMAFVASSDDRDSPGPGTATGEREPFGQEEDLREAPGRTLPTAPGTRGAQAAPGWAHPVNITVSLVDQVEKARRGEATVQVRADGMTIIDPADAREKSVPGQGHLHYKVDNGPVIATTATKLSFHELTPGRHTIEVTPAGNDHKPVGPVQRVELLITR